MRKLLRVLFSRYTISALFFLSELVFLAFMLSYAQAYSYLFFLISQILNTFVVISLINREANPEFKVTWVTVVSFLTFFGALLYIMFYSRKMSKKEIRNLEQIKQTLLTEQIKEESNEALSALSKIDLSAAGRAYSILGADCFSSLYRERGLTYFPSGEEMFACMVEDLSSASKYIFLEYFIVEDGKMWQRIHSVLKEKAAAGVDVRLLYDDIGCMQTLPKGFAARLERDGIKCRSFGRVSPLLVSNHNNRDHRKITVIDGIYAYTGGINIADEYINAKIRFGHWKDGGVRVLGSAAEGFARLFLVNWYITDSGTRPYPMSYTGERVDAVSYGDSAERESGFLIPFGDGPSPLYPEYTAKGVIMNIINRAERYLYITTPYLIIDYDLTEALRGAAKRGVDVRIITPGIADKKIVKIMTKSTYPSLILAGVRIFEYSRGFIHEKLIVSDDENALVGTVNLDYRSLVHHFECALWIFRSPEIKRMREGFMQTVEVSREIDETDAKLSLFEKSVRAAVRLFSPLL